MSEDTESDSVLEWALKHNKTQPIKYKGKWFPKGWLESYLDTGKLNAKPVATPSEKGSKS